MIRIGVFIARVAHYVPPKWALVHLQFTAAFRPTPTALSPDIVDLTEVGETVDTAENRGQNRGSALSKSH